MSAHAAVSFLTVSISPALLLLVVLSAQGGQGSLFKGVPDEKIAAITLRPATGVDAKLINQEKAIAEAAKGVRVAPDAPPAIREALLLWLNEDSRVIPPKERLVWGINFDNPDSVDVDPGVPGCSVSREALYVIVLIDALTGENVMIMEGYPETSPGVCPDEGIAPESAP